MITYIVFGAVFMFALFWVNLLIMTLIGKTKRERSISSIFFYTLLQCVLIMGAFAVLDLWII
ncbi:hypothetical protein [Aureibacillus halotolerans]|uniref:hypothetical protein n=1 Tax=Aureibacillus halotolerans TaxID=1508390 RepID=UPI00105DE035|nr:hypothetical protein [Aureibacillus halotolerans]